MLNVRVTPRDQLPSRLLTTDRQDTITDLLAKTEGATHKTTFSVFIEESEIVHVSLWNLSHGCITGLASDTFHPHSQERFEANTVTFPESAIDRPYQASIREALHPYFMQMQYGHVVEFGSGKTNFMYDTMMRPAGLHSMAQWTAVDINSEVVRSLQDSKRPGDIYSPKIGSIHSFQLQGAPAHIVLGSNIAEITDCSPQLAQNINKLLTPGGYWIHVKPDNIPLTYGSSLLYLMSQDPKLSQDGSMNIAITHQKDDYPYISHVSNTPSIHYFHNRLAKIFEPNGFELVQSEVVPLDSSAEFIGGLVNALLRTNSQAKRLLGNLEQAPDGDHFALLVMRKRANT